MKKSINTGDTGKSKASLDRLPSGQLKVKQKGRPKTARIKDHWISFRVTSDEHYHLLGKSQRSGMGPGEYARSRSLRGIARAKKHGDSPSQIFGETTRDIYHEVRRQGVLLNQIARHCNTHKIPPAPEVTQLAETIMALWQKLLSS